MISTTIIQINVQQILGIDRARTESQRALCEALAVFSREYPEWVAAFFDEHFLLKSLRIKVDGRYTMRCITPRKLAQAWADQFFWQDKSSRAARVDAATPVAAAFLQLFQP